MIHRNIYRGFIAQGADMAPCLPELANEWKHGIESGLLYAASLFRWQDNLFLYYESPDEGLAPETITASLGTALSAQPGTSIRRWTRMMDIFHYHESQDESHWQRSHPNPKATARVNRLKPEMRRRSITLTHTHAVARSHTRTHTRTINHSHTDIPLHAHTRELDR